MMKIVKGKLTMIELNEVAAGIFGNMVKVVVDIDREIIAIDAELHSDLEALLLQDGSKQSSLWGINLYLEAPVGEFIEFDSMINLRPSQGNRSRGVENEVLRRKIAEVVEKRIPR